MKKILDKIKDVKPNKILVTGANNIYINKFCHELSTTLTEEYEKKYSCFFTEENKNLSVNKLNEKIKPLDNIIISGTGILHVCDLINVDLIVFVENTYKKSDIEDNDYKDLILKRVEQIGEPLKLDYFNYTNIYLLRLKFFEYWVMPSLLFDTKKNTCILKEYEINSPV